MLRRPVAHDPSTAAFWCCPLDGTCAAGPGVSDAVLAEAKRGDADAAGRRLHAISDISLLSPDPRALELAKRFSSAAAMPAKAALDALHVALASVHGMDFLLTRNCTHIANAAIRPKIEDICWSSGHRPPVICTPLELLENEDHEP